MPGQKLKELREKKAADFEGSQTKDEEGDKADNPYKVGDIVRQIGKSLTGEICEVEGSRVKITKPSGKPSNWISYNRVQLISTDEGVTDD